MYNFHVPVSGVYDGSPARSGSDSYANIDRKESDEEGGRQEAIRTGQYAQMILIVETIVDALNKPHPELVETESSRVTMTREECLLAAQERARIADCFRKARARARKGRV